MKKSIAVFIFLAFSITTAAQYNFKCRVKNAVSNEVVCGATVALNEILKHPPNKMELLKSPILQKVFIK